LLPRPGVARQLVADGIPSQQLLGVYVDDLFGDRDTLRSTPVATDILRATTTDCCKA
jgi:hypothetical protein